MQVQMQIILHLNCCIFRSNECPYICRDSMILELMKEITKMYLHYKQTNQHVVNTNTTLIVYSLQDSRLNNSSWVMWMKVWEMIYKIKSNFRMNNESPRGQGIMIAVEFIFHYLPFPSTEHTHAYKHKYTVVLSLVREMQCCPVFSIGLKRGRLRVQA